MSYDIDLSDVSDGFLDAMSDIEIHLGDGEDQAAIAVAVLEVARQLDLLNLNLSRPE